MLTQKETEPKITTDKERLEMIILIAGASHTGKTALAQRLLETHTHTHTRVCMEADKKN